ncbi:MAG: AarF/UbiB family protein [ANME-2 cluster archaeon]|jgi:ubiquinone biosynthesis protein|nr:AarF/UbiB family protein [ANME-2 cluster archaeon]
MFSKIKRYIKITRVFNKYRLFSILLKESRLRAESVDLCTCPIDFDRRSSSVKLRMALEELGPSFIKLGQAMSKRPDIVPIEYGAELEKLQERVQPYDFERMQEAFSVACGTTSKDTRVHSDFTTLFDKFNKEPIASASIAQVYEAVLNGENVAVKIARPGMMDVINLDLDILYDLKFIFLKLLKINDKIDIDGFLEEFKTMLNRELDYRNEALNMERFRENFKDFNQVHIPKVYWELTNDNMIVMEHIYGVPLREYRAFNSTEKKRVAKLISSSFLKMVYIDGFFHADPHPGNIFVMKNGNIAYLDFGAIGKLDSDIMKDMYSVFYAVYIKNVDMVATSMLKMAQKAVDEIDIHAFKWDIDELISRQHYGRGERHSDDFVKLALKYDLSLPRTFSLLERALVLVESTCLDLDPDFNLMDEVKALSREIAKKKYSPTRVVEDFQMEWDNIYEAFKSVPSGINDIFETLRIIKTLNIDKQENAAKKERFVDRILQSLYIVALLVSSAALLVFARGEPVLEMVGIGGFAISIILGTMVILKK